MTHRTSPVAGAALLAVSVASCVPTYQAEYGDPALAVRQYPVLDSAVARHLESRVTVWTLLDLAPSTQRPTPRTVTVSGNLAGFHDGWLHLLRRDGDSIRIGKDFVVRVQLARSGTGDRLAGAVVGGTMVGLLGWFVARNDPDRPAGEAVIMIGGGAVLGGVVGVMVAPSLRPGVQLYPPVRARGTS